VASDSQPPKRDVTAVTGEIIDARYRIQAVLGDGGMGSVYRAEHLKLRKPVALKLLHKRFAENAAFAERFEREAMAAGRIKHPNCVGVSDFGRLPSGKLYLVMELVEGNTLGELLKQHGRLPVPRAIHIARHALAGLGHAHSVGIVHRDVKPDNILLIDHEGDRDFAKLVDFGIAKLVGEAAAEVENAQLTQVGTTVGTPKYMPPEQAFGKEVDGRADLYSMAVVLYAMLTGHPPFDADDVIELLMQHATADPPSFASMAPQAKIPPVLESVVRKGLAKKRDDRYPSAEVFSAALDQALDAYYAAKEDGTLAPIGSATGTLAGLGQPVAPASQTMPTAMSVASLPAAQPPWLRRIRPKHWAMGLGVVALFGIIALSAASDGEEPTPPPLTGEGGKLEAALDLLEDGAAVLTGGGPSELALKTKKLNEAGKHREVLSMTKGKELDGHASLQRGHAAAATGKVVTALESYLLALRETPSLRDTKSVFAFAERHESARRTQTATLALELLARYHGDESARTRLVELAGESSNRTQRQKARAIAEDLGYVDEINLARSYSLDLVQNTTCEKRLGALLTLESLGDPRALPAIKKARHRMRGGVLGLGEKNTNRCLKKDADRVIEALEAKL